MRETERICRALTVGELFRFPEHSLAYPLLQRYLYPWEVLSVISEFLCELGERLPWAEYQQTGEDIWISRSASVASSVEIAGPCIIGPHAELRQGAFLRGGTLVGEGAVVGNSTELKNCILFDGVQVPHYNYVGDSVLGYRAHLGAGAITSNVKGNKTPVTLKMGERVFETGRKKFGAILGDFAEVGCNSVLNPGTVIGVNTQVYPLCSVRGYVPAESIYKEDGRIIPKK